MEEPVAYFCQGTEALTLDKSDPLVFEKEAIYESKEFDAKGLKFSVDGKALDHWATMVDLFLERGITIPMPIGHVTDPTAKRAEVIGAVRRKNSKGKESLYIKGRFRDEKAKEELKTANVSLHSPKEWEVNGKTYRWPIVHVAFTDYPCIPGLEQLKLLSASLTIEAPKKMSLATVAEKLGLPHADKSDEELTTAVMARFDEMQKQIEELSTGSSSTSVDGEEDAGPAVSASLIGVVKRSRTLELDDLTNKGIITPAIRKDLDSRFVSDKAITLSLSNAETPDGFDLMVSTLRKNGPVLSLSSKTGRQAADDGGRGGAEKNPLLADAEARAKNHKR